MSIANQIEYCKKLKGYAKRRFIALFCFENFLTQEAIAKLFGVSRDLVRKSIKEEKEGKEIKSEVEKRGRKSVEEKWPELKEDINAIVRDNCSTDPRFKTEEMYVRLTEKEIRKALIKTGKYTEETLPKKSALSAYINKIGYRLKKVKKTKPQKKIKETDDIFNNINSVKEKNLEDNDTVVISIDTKDKVKIGDYSRKGYARTEVKALDHDFESEYLTPFGILDLKTNQTYLYNTTSKVTADFMIDAIKDFWEKSEYNDKKKLVIFLDNGPENSSTRTRFIYRLVHFADMCNIEVELAYYPPYHSKYNPIERIWARLENIWNGSLLSNIQTCLNYMKNMTWNSIKTKVYFTEKQYNTGIIETKETMKFIEKYISRKKGIEKWAVQIIVS